MQYLRVGVTRENVERLPGTAPAALIAPELHGLLYDASLGRAVTAPSCGRCVSTVALRVSLMPSVLGANGVIGRGLSRHLPEYSDRIRQVSRSPKRVNATDELFSADLLGCPGDGGRRG